MEMIPVFMAVSQDKYELPLAVADSMWELARLRGVTESAVCKGITRQNRGQKSKYIRVWIEMTAEEYAAHMERVRMAQRRAAGLC
jgi:hypothetical protein